MVTPKLAVLLSAALSCAACTVCSPNEPPAPDLSTQIVEADTSRRPACPEWSFDADGESRTLLWPTGAGLAPQRLLNTYGQAEGPNASELHLAIDVIAEQGDPVYALEAGEVVRVEVLRPSPFEYGLVVASKAVPGRAFLYLHVVPAEAFELGQEVQANELLGTVAPDEEAHVHLARLEGDVVGQPWDLIDVLSVRNPLALLDPGVLGDETDPVIELVAGKPLAFRSNELRSNSYLSYPHEDELVSGPLDLIARVHDRDGRSGVLAPYVLTLSIDGQVESRIVLDGRLGPWRSDDVYSRKAPLKSVGNPTDPSDFYFELTNGDVTGTAPSPYRCWDAPEGDHVLDLCVRDVRGNETRASMCVSVAPRP